MSQTELESYIALKYLPMVATNEYARIIPLEVKKNYVIFKNVESEEVINSSFKSILNAYLSDGDRQIIDILWTALKRDLLEYHGRKGF